MTALHLAAQRGMAEVVNLLLEGGARVNNKMNDKVNNFILKSCPYGPTSLSLPLQLYLPPPCFFLPASSSLLPPPSFLFRLA